MPEVSVLDFSYMSQYIPFGFFFLGLCHLHPKESQMTISYSFFPNLF